MVLGEPQIVAQVKQAWQLAQKSGTTGPLTGELFQAALRAAKRVTTETAVGRERLSIPSIAVADLPVVCLKDLMTNMCFLLVQEKWPLKPFAIFVTPGHRTSAL